MQSTLRRFWQLDGPATPLREGSAVQWDETPIFPVFIPLNGIGKLGLKAPRAGRNGSFRTNLLSRQ